MSDDPRCCGSGTCIIDPAGRCWCGQQWDGTAMRPARLAPVAPAPQTGHAADAATATAEPDRDPNLP
ncbi:MAG: hypothetical protein AB9M60_12500 [Leptothrix sp. (in: b-proteobacteria)]